MVLTDSATSAPIPSPGIRVTVYLPPYLVGLKMSYNTTNQLSGTKRGRTLHTDCTVAKVRDEVWAVRNRL